MKNEKFYPGGPHFSTSAGPDVELRMGGRRATFVIRFDKGVEWFGFGLLELRRFHAVVGRHLREMEARNVAEVLKDPAPPDDGDEVS